VETPALLVRLDALEANVKNMTAHLGALAPNVNIRPHARSHKTAEIASMQMQQARHIGICCQKVSEAVAMADTVGDILLTSSVVSLPKARRLANLARRGCSVTVVADSKESLDVLTAAARGEGIRLGVLIEVDVGQGRCGVESPAEAVMLAKAVESQEEFDFRGIQAYHRGIQHVREWSARSAAAAEVASRVGEFVRALNSAGLACEIITGGGTGTCAFDARAEYSQRSNLVVISSRMQIMARI
jgi:D-serine deaminase-like pyridoxal phosphate-dependent protein